MDPDLSDVTIPSEILTQYRKVIAFGDIMFINKLAFFVSISHNLKFSTAELMLNQNIIPSWTTSSMCRKSTSNVACVS